MAMIEVKNITKSFNVKKFNKETNKYEKDVLTVLRDFTVDFKQEGVTVLLGPSGTGKSTLLRCINGLETVDKGDILVDGMSVKDKKNLGKIRETCGMVFQQTVLFPHKDVLDNLTMAPVKLLKMPRKDAEDRARQLLDKVGLLSKEKAHHNELSGGEQQRIAIARADDEPQGPAAGRGDLRARPRDDQRGSAHSGKPRRRGRVHAGRHP